MITLYIVLTVMMAFSIGLILGSLIQYVVDAERFIYQKEKEVAKYAIEHAKAIVAEHLVDGQGSSYVENKHIESDRLDIIEALDKWVEEQDND
jgi:uncharacterized membrane protein YraQ (UPF0718 family)